MKYKGRDFNMLCNCGTTDESFEAALRLAKQSFRGSDDCGVWHLAVAEQYLLIVKHLFMARQMQVTGDTEDGAFDSQNFVYNLVVANMVGNKDQNENTSKFVCEIVPNAYNAQAITEGPEERHSTLHQQIDAADYTGQSNGGDIANMLVSLFGADRVFKMGDEGIEPVDTPLSDAVKKSKPH